MCVYTLIGKFMSLELSSLDEATSHELTYDRGIPITR